MNEITIQDSHTIDADKAPERTGRLAWRLLSAATLAMVLSAAIPLLGPVPAADARIESAWAHMGCGSEEIWVYMPDLRSSHRDAMVVAAPVLKWRDGNTWRAWQSGDWTYSVTKKDGSDNTWFFWSTRNSLFPVGARFWKFNVVPGYEYAIELVVGDTADRHQTTIWAQNNAGSQICRA